VSPRDNPQRVLRQIVGAGVEGQGGRW